MTAGIDWSGLTAFVLAVVPVLAAAVAQLLRLYLREKRGADVLSGALESEEPREAIKKATTLDTDLRAHLDAVRDRTSKTKRIDPPKKEPGTP